MATMLDVSRHAGVSKATVSRVLNGTGQVKKARARKCLRRCRLWTIAPTYWHARWRIAPATASVWSSLRLTASISVVCCAGRRAAELHNKQLIVTDGHDTPEREQKAVQMLADRQCDAIILYTRYMDEPAILSLIDATEMPLVIINRNVTQARDRAIFFEQETAAFGRWNI